MGKEKKERKKLPKGAKLAIFVSLGALILVFILNIVILPLTGEYGRTSCHRYDDENQYIAGEGMTMLSAHRAGGGVKPEETKAAFRQCMENEAGYKVDIVEFDVHLTSDDHLVLMHDHEIDRTSNGEEVYGPGKTVQDLTLEQLEQLNFGYDFQDKDGNYPYRDLKTPEEIKEAEVGILTLDDILTYLEEVRPNKDLNYVIEIKDKGNVGKKSMDLLYQAMVDHKITDRVIVGTFNGDITNYMDKMYKGKKGTVKRSAGILEVLNFYFAFLWGVKQNPDKLGYDVLQIPVGLTTGFYDFTTEAFIDYAHSLGIAVQYWTINDPDMMRRLIKNGADTVMTDDPDVCYPILQEMKAVWKKAA